MLDPTAGADAPSRRAQPDSDRRLSSPSSDPLLLQCRHTLAKAMDIETALRAIAKDINVLYISCALFSSIRKFDSNLLTAKVTFPFRWQTRYFMKRYVTIDPVIIHGKTALEPYDWQDLRTGDPAVENFIADSVRHGVGRNGYSVPVRSDPDADFSIVSFNTNHEREEWERFKAEKAGLMAGVAILIDGAARSDLRRHTQPAFLARR